MVNTFIVDMDYAASAAKLDYKRLGKQRVEAYQILNNIQDQRYLANIAGIDIAEYKTKKLLIAAIRKYYKSVDYDLVYSSTGYYRIKRGSIKLRLNNVKGKAQLNTDGTYTHTFKKVPTIYRVDEVLPENHRLVGTGFWSHPAVLMWYDYPEQLKSYINTHIAEWIKRGYTNTMSVYNIDHQKLEQEGKPSWITNKFIQVHKAALYDKEVKRQEPQWYGNFQDFVRAPIFVDYIWPVA